MKIIEVVCG